jgi:hypothetical protein
MWGYFTLRIDQVYWNGTTVKYVALDAMFPISCTVAAA